MNDKVNALPENPDPFLLLWAQYMATHAAVQALIQSHPDPKAFAWQFSISSSALQSMVFRSPEKLAYLPAYTSKVDGYWPSSVQRSPKSPSQKP